MSTSYSIDWKTLSLWRTRELAYNQTAYGLSYRIETICVFSLLRPFGRKGHTKTATFGNRL